MEESLSVTYLIIMVQLNNEELEDQIIWKKVSQSQSLIIMVQLNDEELEDHIL